jgi:hypothetical protein
MNSYYLDHTHNQYALLDRENAEKMEKLSDYQLSQLFPIVINWKEDFVGSSPSFQEVVIHKEGGFHIVQEELLRRFNALLFEDLEQVSKYLRQSISTKLNIEIESESESE